MSKTNAAGHAPRSTARARLGGQALRTVALAGVALLASASAAVVAYTGAAGPFLSGLIGGFAVFGALWALLRLWKGLNGEAETGEVAKPAVVADSADAMAVVEDGERVVEANAAYRAMCRNERGEPPSPERFLSRVPGTQAAMSELLNAVADGKAFTRRISFDSGSGGRQIEISVQPLDSRRRVLWSLRVIEAQEAASPAAAPVAAASAGTSQAGPVAPASAGASQAPAAASASAASRAAPAAQASAPVSAAAAPAPATPRAAAPGVATDSSPRVGPEGAVGAASVATTVSKVPEPSVAKSPPQTAKAPPVAAPPAAKAAAARPAEAVVEAAPPAALDEETAAALLEAWERAPAGVARFGREKVGLANASLCRLLGYSLAEWPVEGMALQEVVAPAHVSYLRGALGAGRGPASLELDLTRKDGRALAVFMRLGVCDAAGEATAIILPRSVLSASGAAPAAPATQPTPASAPARAAGDVDRFFLRAPVALALLDAQGRIRAANAAFARLFGPDAAAAGKPLRAVISERDAAAVDAFLGEARSGAQPSGSCDVTATGAGGRSARLYAAPLGVAAGPGDDIALCAIDTSEQKALEAQFAQSQRLQAVGHLAGGVAHDFNNVLTAIIGYCDLLLAKHRPSDPSFPDIMQIKQNANRAAALVRQLLAFSRRQTLRPQAVELTDVISDVSELLRRLIGERITLEVQHARDLWPVKVDVNQFEQVIVNLVVNARDAMPDGGTLTVRTANVPAGACAAYGAGNLAPADYVVVEVEDTGTGIPPDIIDKIFEPFFSTKEVGKGTGLGLSTVYGIVQQTGGTILAASEPGKGSVFRVFLPRYVPSEEAEPQRAAEPEVKMGDSTGQGRILLVEDEDAVRAFASRALSARGYEVLTAASGVEALELLAKGGQPVDLVISDVVMPEMDGPSLLKELRARDPAMKVIFISGYAEEAFARNLPPSEHFAFLPKPFSLKQLVAAVNTAMRGGE
ncbi:hybrid sensor histidine kinase/response regulator [Xanthobacter sediminis]|uniref:hybrid sensor histidine kinase/response regulator n=1 Tax=Xanthobacter sediminis TaxID=3119926 RepID=UPI00372AB45D